MWKQELRRGKKVDFSASLMMLGAAALAALPAAAGNDGVLTGPTPTGGPPPCRMEQPAETLGTVRGPSEVPLEGEWSWTPQVRSAGASSVTVGTIENIGEFLEVCPTQDPAYSQIRSDFHLRHNDVLVGSLSCTGPVSAVPIADWTDELVVIQGLRAIYYMDQGMAGHLPWTGGTLYEWMKSKIDGINLKGSGAWCCQELEGELYIVVGESDDFNRDFDRYWRGIIGNIALYAHETRHADGYGHVSCCGITGGCDENFDVADLTPYGIQWWLNSLWLSGEINVGVGCLSPAEINDIAVWHLGSLNTQFRERFCYTKPPLVGMPAAPGGPCGLIFSHDFDSGGLVGWSNWMF